MAAFHVFVEGAVDDSPAGIPRLAEAIAKHYGLGAPDLLARLQKGRFRVKGNTDRTTAETYKRDLERLGARCTIEEATADNSQRTTPLPFPAVRPATPPVGTPVAGAARTSTPPPVASGPGASALAAAGARPSTPPPIGGGPGASALAAAGASAAASPPAPTGSGQFQSGLAAAFSGEMPAADLGALGSNDAAFSLASLDGVDDKSAAGGSFGPPADASAIPASIGPAPEKKKPAADAKPAKPKDEPLDMFAPPDMQGEEFKVDIAADEGDFSARKRASTPPPVDEAAAAAATGDGARPSSQRLPATPLTRKSQPSMQVPNAPAAAATSVPSKLGPLADERVRFGAGVVLSVLLGFVPAHLVASMKESSADDAIDRKVIAAQQTADTPEVYATLDRLRADQLDRKESEHRNAAIIGFAIWAIVGGGLAFLWFRKIPWDA